LEPENADTLYLYAYFLNNKRKDYDRAEDYYKKVVKLAPDKAFYLGAYADFLENIRKDYGGAEDLFKKALILEPDNSINLGNFAVFLTDIKKDHNQAEKLFKKSLQFEQKNDSNMVDYAKFLMEIRQDYAQAEQLYKNALAADPEDAYYLGTYAKILIVLGDLDKAKKVILQAFESNKHEADPELELELWFYCYAVFYKDFPDSAASIETLLKQGVRSTGWYLKDVLETASRKGHPDFEKLSEFEKRITGEPE
jgi:tetratricopeptide (TPR) repeat protein